MDSQDHKLDTWQVASHDNCHTVLGEKTLAQSEPALENAVYTLRLVLL